MNSDAAFPPPSSWTFRQPNDLPFFPPPFFPPTSTTKATARYSPSFFSFFPHHGGASPAGCIDFFAWLHGGPARCLFATTFFFGHRQRALLFSSPPLSFPPSSLSGRAFFPPLPFFPPPTSGPTTEFSSPSFFPPPSLFYLILLMGKTNPFFSPPPLLP